MQQELKWKQHCRQVKTNRPSQETYSPRPTLGEAQVRPEKDQLSHGPPVMLVPEKKGPALPRPPCDAGAGGSLCCPQGLCLIWQCVFSRFVPLDSNEHGFLLPAVQVTQECRGTFHTLLSSASPTANPGGLLPTSPPPLRGSCIPQGWHHLSLQTHTAPPLLCSRAE